MNWDDKTTTKKGNIGERLVHSFLLNKKITPYVPISKQAHPFDSLCASQDKRRIFIVEVKTKEARKYYQDTGINVSHYNDYTYIQNKLQIPVWIFFVDADNKKIYGNKLSELEKPQTINKNEYPLTQKGIIYFPLINTKTICELSDDDCDEIKRYDTKNYTGAWKIDVQ